MKLRAIKPAENGGLDLHQQQRKLTVRPTLLQPPLRSSNGDVQSLCERLEVQSAGVRGQLALRFGGPIDRMHPESWASLELLIGAYYPLDDPNLHLVRGGELDIRALGEVGRTSETGRLRKVLLSPPYALGGEWRHSPMARERGFHFDLHRALEQHAALTRYLLNNGVEVHLMLHQERASEAVYATDSITGVGKCCFVGSPKHHTRQLEQQAYSGGVRIAPFSSGKGPVEFGDVLFFSKNDTLYVLQGYQSWRSTPDSVRALSRALDYAKRKGYLANIDRIEHIPIELSGKDTLHLDYVLNYAGGKDNRVLTVCRSGLAHPERVIPRLQKILGVSDERVIEVNREEMLAGAANLSSLSSGEVLYIDSPETDRVAEAMRAAGLRVTRFAYDQMSQKDGTLHCCIGQLLRD